MLPAPGMKAASPEAPPVPRDRPGQLSLQVERPARLEGNGRSLFRALEGGPPGGIRLARPPGVRSAFARTRDAHCVSGTSPAARDFSSARSASTSPSAVSPVSRSRAASRR